MFNVNLDLLKSPLHKLLFTIELLLSLIIPGFAYIFIDLGSLFLDLPTSKIILLAIFYSLPILFINITFEYFLVSRGKQDIELATFGATSSTLINTYLAFFLFEFFGLKEYGFYVLMVVISIISNFPAPSSIILNKLRIKKDRC